MVRELGLSAVRSAEEHQRTPGKEKQLFMVKTFCTLLELVTVRQRIIESAAETELVSRYTLHNLSDLLNLNHFNCQNFINI